MKQYAEFNNGNEEDIEVEKIQEPQSLNIHSPAKVTDSSQKLGFNLSYTINLNLPATSDIAVFNAIFKSLKENLLKDSENG